MGLRITTSLSGCLCLAVLGTGPIVAQGAEDGAPTVGTLSGFRLSASAYPEGVTSEAGYRRALQEREAKLRLGAQAAASPRVRAQLGLAWANVLLGDQAGETATALLLGYATDEQTRYLHALAEKAIKAVESVGEWLDQAGEKASDEELDALDALYDHADALTGLAHIMAAATGPRGPAGQGAVRAAALELAAALESENTKITTAARLWHGVALARVGSHEAALTAIDVSTARPKENALGLFAWIARCRVLAERGSEAVAIAITLRLEERCEDWFRDEARQAEARRTLMLSRARIASAWARRLEGAGNADAAKRIAALAEKALTAAADEEDPTLLRLERAVPALVDPPKGGRVALFGLDAYVEQLVVVVDRSEAVSADLAAVRAEVARLIDSLNDKQRFQVLLLGADGMEQIGSGNLLEASPTNRQRAKDLLDAATPIAKTRADVALRKALALAPDRIFFIAGTSVDAALAKRVKAWNPDGKVAVDVIGVEGVSDANVLERLATENQGRLRMLKRPLSGADASNGTNKP